MTDGLIPGGCKVRIADGRWRGLLAWTIAAALVVAGLAVGLGFRTVLGWLAAAVLAGLAATIAGLVQATANKGLVAGKELLTGTNPPITLSVRYWQQPVSFIHDPDQLGPGHLMRCGFVILTIQATAVQAVILDRLRVIIDSREPGTDIPADHAHAPLPLRKFLVDLDRDVPEPVPEGPARPRASIMDAHHVGTPDFPYTVSPHDPERFQVMAYTDRHDVRWRLGLDWVCGDKTGTVLIDNNGQPFRLAQAPGNREDAEAANQARRTPQSGGGAGGGSL